MSVQGKIDNLEPLKSLENKGFKGCRFKGFKVILIYYIKRVYT